MWSFSDEALVTGFAKGDPGAGAAFVRRFQARVYGLAVSMVGDPAIAEEIAQEAFVRAWRHGDGYDARRGRVVTWLLAITRNLAIDHLRSRRPEPIDPAAADTADALWVRASAGGETGPGEDTVEIREALGDLPGEQRRALLLAALYGYTASEVGAIEDIPLGTAKTRIRTAMQKLAKAEEAVDRNDDQDEERGER
jgi:RNA polymerase sigma-70 factor (ECF subfamily)